MIVTQPHFKAGRYASTNGSIFNNERKVHWAYRVSPLKYEHYLCRLMVARAGWIRGGGAGRFGGRNLFILDACFHRILRSEQAR